MIANSVIRSWGHYVNGSIPSDIAKVRTAPGNSGDAGTFLPDWTILIWHVVRHLTPTGDWYVPIVQSTTMQSTCILTRDRHLHERVIVWSKVTVVCQLRHIGLRDDIRVCALYRAGGRYGLRCA